MRTTVDLPAPLVRMVQKLARQRRTTFRALVTSALRRYLAAEEAPRRAFKLPDRSFQGDGLAEGMSNTDWARIRDLSYDRRGDP